ncbi:MAG: hypothetical protein WD749_04480 [Phycisphaerales bacterium]
MKTGGFATQSVRAALVVAIAAGTSMAGVVNPSWRRTTDWVPGSAQGGISGNPGPVGGSPVWQYEWTNGGALGSSNPWFENPGNLMTWDGAWWATGWGVWSKGDDNSPPILAGRLIHNVVSTEYANIPMVRWRNPLQGNSNSVDVAGTLLVNWNGLNGLGRPGDVDVVIAKHTAATNLTSILYSTTVSKPNPFPSVGDSVLLPVNLTNVGVDAGDSIIISHRGRTPLFPIGGWINLYDGVTITAIPAPGAAGVLALAGLAALRRRRRAT